MKKIGGEPIRRWCQIAYLEPIHRCCTFVSMMKIGTWRTNPFTKWKLVEAIPEQNRSPRQLAADYPCLRGFSWNFSSGKRKRAAKRRHRVQKRRGEREKPLSLLAASRLVVSDLWRLACSFAKKNFKKNLWAQSSGESIRRWFKIVLQVVHTDGQGHSHRRFRGRLCFSLTACRTLKIVLRALRTYR